MTAAVTYPSIDAFYNDNRKRRNSGEADYGVHWRADGQGWPSWRISYIQATGEVYAVRLHGNPMGPVRVLGIVAPDPVPTPRNWASSATYYRTLDAILDGWAEPDVSGHDLAWVERKLAAYRDLSAPHVCVRFANAINNQYVKRCYPGPLAAFEAAVTERPYNNTRVSLDFCAKQHVTAGERGTGA